MACACVFLHDKMEMWKGHAARHFNRGGTPSGTSSWITAAFLGGTVGKSLISLFKELCRGGRT